MWGKEGVLLMAMPKPRWRERDSRWWSTGVETEVEAQGNGKNVSLLNLWKPLGTFLGFTDKKNTGNPQKNAVTGYPRNLGEGAVGCIRCWTLFKTHSI